MPFASALFYRIRSLARTGLLLPAVCVAVAICRLRFCRHLPFVLLLSPAGRIAGACPQPAVPPRASRIISSK
ncbi:hypothetical protein [Methanimicrococcus blatticola]|uniref:hypothetical protein n=1 Tax=Methanimicrococcus blatticola TaxID=91560 RepID=UPI0010605DBD|nr:hypothetical protein [Methanimicrococcus blatticola]MBZ3934853.1 hypothetical protein [Methanimicrococcus blatticola]MCC2509049.1 hypothetical protein [Methanimicrococcus blatticola]